MLVNSLRARLSASTSWWLAVTTSSCILLNWRACSACCEACCLARSASRSSLLVHPLTRTISTASGIRNGINRRGRAIRTPVGKKALKQSLQRNCAAAARGRRRRQVRRLSRAVNRSGTVIYPLGNGMILTGE